MTILPEARSAVCSVREFAEFRLGPGREGERRASLWRAEVGRQWHEELRRRGERGAEAALLRFEQTLEATLPLVGWQLTVQGRLDQLLVDALGTPQRVREVKTVRRSLPRPPDELRTDFPEYFNQAAVYAVLLARSASVVAGVGAELVFVDIDDGLVQTVPLEAAEIEERFARQAAVWAEFLEERARAHGRRRTLHWQPAFPSLRPGQEETRRALDALSRRTPMLSLEAPTGFGKTGLALEHAAGRLREGSLDRVIYLTGKSTGQLQVLTQIRRMFAPGALRAQQMRSRAEFAAGDRILPPRDGRELEARWQAARVRPEAVLEAAPLDPEALYALGAQHNLPAHALAAALLPHADFWLGDYNYVFAPGASSLFWEQPGFVPARTLLIIDEAHNLASRAAACWTAELSLGDLYALLLEVRVAGLGGKLVRALENLESCLRDLSPAPALEAVTEYELLEHLEAACACIERLPWDPEALKPETYERLWALCGLRHAWKHPGLERLLWSPAAGVLLHTCLSAACETAPRLRAFGEVLFLSATLRPHAEWLADLGLRAEEAPLLLADAPWREGAYRVAVDQRVDTSYNQRDRHLRTTAETLQRLCVGGRLPVAVFLPSYRYAEAVRHACAALDPGLRLALPPRGVSLAEQEAFIESSLMGAHALLLVLGTGFTEGIDLLGGRVTRALVVGPALPEVNPVQKARTERTPGGAPVAFRRVYLIPGLTKVNQALGRLVRGPGQQAEVILHCRRFADPAYADLLSPEYACGDRLRSAQDLENWLRAGER